ncbi:MAG: hypothetical protein WKF87_15245 [Chryseolinea sp.]
MNSLDGKRVLLIAARFFGYEDEIRLKLVSLGASVDFFDQRPSNSFLTKALIRVNKKFLSRRIRTYYAQLLERTRDVHYDYILFISPEVITGNAFRELKQAHPAAKLIVYMWDSIRNKGKNIQDILPLFDYRLSFDKGDCESSALKIHYRPLFFLNDYFSILQVPKRKYDLLFVGTIHSDRHRILMALREICLAESLSYFYYMYFPSRLLFYMRAVLDPSLRNTSKEAFKFYPLRKNEIIALMETSNVIVDIQHPKQTGLTMRTIEVLGARKKLLTTNSDIVTYDFYNPENILVIDRDNIKVDLSFFKTSFVELEPAIYQKYSIDGWISDIFNLHQQGNV